MQYAAKTDGNAHAALFLSVCNRPPIKGTPQLYQAPKIAATGEIGQ